MRQSTHVDFTKRKIEHLPILASHQVIQHAYSERYLGVTVDAKFRQKQYVKKKLEELRIKFRKT